MTPLDQLRIAIVFGGPSSERDISLDSARTFFDAIRFLLDPANIALFFVERDLGFSRVDQRWIYSNTTDDFLLSRDAQADRGGLAFADAVAQFQGMDAIFSFVHGTYGEDGAFERALRGAGCTLPLLGSGAGPLETLYDKELTLAALARLGFRTTAAIALDPGDPAGIAQARKFALARGRVVVKPARGGSSDGVTMATAADIEGAVRTAAAFSERVLVEAFIAGREFSLIVFQGSDGAPMPLLPTEIIVRDAANPLYTRLKKYMPGSGAVHINPAAFPEPALATIRAEAARLFTALGLEDWARFDGFLLDDGDVIWSDLNGVPGYGADSLLFQQAALFGFDQSAISFFLLARVLAKAGVTLPPFERTQEGARRVSVLGGGETSERQVSRMSWLNVIQKLGYTRRNDVRPVYVDRAGRLFRVPYVATLQHTVEEVDELIESPARLEASLARASAIRAGFDPAFAALAARDADTAIAELTLADVAAMSDFIFLALHGGRGEGGDYQRALDTLGVPYNGSGPDAAAVFMDKAATATLLAGMTIPGVRAPRNMRVDLADVRLRHARLLAEFRTLARRGVGFGELERDLELAGIQAEIAALIAGWRETLASPAGLVFKPVADGCSSGVFIWRSGEAGAARFLLAALSGLDEVRWSLLGPKYAVMPDEVTLKLPFDERAEFLVEELHASEPGSTVIELTAAVYGRAGAMVAMIPSQTLTEFDLLTLEEKFCKGVGVNVTPPTAIDDAKVQALRGRIAAIANGLGVRGYARIDLMYYLEADELVLIEVNSLPGLSMATVTFTQALVTPGIAMPPSEFLEAIIAVGS